MNLIALVVQAASEGQAEGIASTFGVNWPHLGAQVISFSLVCALMYRFAYKPVLKMLEERRQQIALGLANAEKINAKLADIEAKRLEVLAQARIEATRIVGEARDTARRLKELEGERAAAAAEATLARAREAATHERARTMADLRAEVGRLVVRTTAAVTGKILTSDDQRRLAEATAWQLAPSSPSQAGPDANGKTV